MEQANEHGRVGLFSQLLTAQDTARIHDREWGAERLRIMRLYEAEAAEFAAELAERQRKDAAWRALYEGRFV